MSSLERVRKYSEYWRHSIMPSSSKCSWSVRVCLFPKHFLLVSSSLSSEGILTRESDVLVTTGLGFGDLMDLCCVGTFCGLKEAGLLGYFLTFWAYAASLTIWKWGLGLIEGWTCRVGCWIKPEWTGHFIFFLAKSALHFRLMAHYTWNLHWHPSSLH